MGAWVREAGREEGGVGGRVQLLGPRRACGSAPTASAALSSAAIGAPRQVAAYRTRLSDTRILSYHCRRSGLGVRLALLTVCTASMEAPLEVKTESAEAAAPLPPPPAPALFSGAWFKSTIIGGARPLLAGCRSLEERRCQRVVLTFSVEPTLPSFSSTDATAPPEYDYKARWDALPSCGAAQPAVFSGANMQRSRTHAFLSFCASRSGHTRGCVATRCACLPGRGKRF